MPVCRDPLVANLRAQGFNTLRVPRKDYVPGKTTSRHQTTQCQSRLERREAAGAEMRLPPKGKVNADGLVDSSYPIVNLMMKNARSSHLNDLRHP
jgi:hypothetical protein